MVNIPPFVKKIIESKLKRKISLVKILDNSEFIFYIVLTDKGYLHFRCSQEKERIRRVTEFLALCKKEGIPVPEIMYAGETENASGRLFAVVEGIKGDIFTDKRLNIYEYNRTLTAFAEILLKLHSISIEKVGFLKSNSKKTKSASFNQTPDIDEQLTFLEQKKVLSPTISRAVRTFFRRNPTKTYPSVLHGNISTQVLYINRDLQITSFTNFIKPILADPHYEMAGFLINEGFDRTKRLVKSYYLLGGFVEMDSEKFLQTALKRSIGTLYWRTIAKQRNSITGLRELVFQLVSQLKYI